MATGPRASGSSASRFQRNCSFQRPRKLRPRRRRRPASNRPRCHRAASAGCRVAWSGVVVACFLALAMVVGFVAVSGGGGGASGPWSVTEPQNDFAPSFPGGQAIENPSAVGDVIGLDVAVGDGNTTVTVTFAGGAERLMTEGGEELSATLQFIPVGDERWIDIVFSEDGSVKIADGPSGSRITATWTSSNVLVFEVTGATPAPGATVRFATIQRQGFGHSTDEVSLATGDADSVVATAFVTSPSSDGGVPEAPVIVSPCIVLVTETISGVFGPSVRVSGGGDGRRVSKCEYEAAGAGADAWREAGPDDAGSAAGAGRVCRRSGAGQAGRSGCRI